MKTKGTELSESCIIKMRLTGKEKIIALAGNPNVGKSTLFNFLTGMRQHTGNWPGKTVGCAAGIHRFKGNDYLFVDLPGAYSLSPTSPEEEAAEEYIALGKADVVIAVCDATSLEKSLSLAFQVKETGAKTIICVTLTDEAQKKGIEINYKKLSEITGVPVIPVCAKIGKGIPELLEETEKLTLNGEKIKPARLKYQRDLEKEISRLSSLWVRPEIGGRFAAEKFLEKGKSAENIRKRLAIRDDSLFLKEVKASEEILRKKGFDSEKISDELALAPIKAAEKAARETVSYRKEEYDKKDRLFDKILTGKYTAVPLMCLMLLFIFWLTISAANYPSELLGKLLFSLEKPIFDTLKLIGVPIPFCDMISHGMYRVLAWVVSVMLPPMAIFFPLFTLLEDLGYLPRIAFNLDLPFKQAGTCGKQALTMCMGFGCNAAGVTGTRIISSPRERLIAVITNNFVPCNGRFPTLIAIITMFFTAGKSSFSGAVYLTLIIILGVCVTLAASSFLSKTLLKGVPSFFTLELPPYRTPQVGKVIVRSVFDRTLFVLGRAAAVAAPAGMIIWIFANLSIGGDSLLRICSDFLDPFARIFGLDGVILFAFILGFPANEIVLPIILMAYTSSGALAETANIFAVREILTANGWTAVTALCVILFSLMHFPCSTTMLTIKKETGSLKWTLISFLLPTVTGLIFCFIISGISRIF